MRIDFGRSAWKNGSVTRSVSAKRNFSLIIIIVSLAVLLGVSVLFNIGLWLQRGKNAPSVFVVRQKCMENGFLTKEQFLAHYRIGNNETLQSIAGTQLHDQSRSHEIYLLNEDQLVKKGFGEGVVLPEGMTLLIPPEEARFSSANILGIVGRIMKVTNDSMIVTPKTGLTISLYIDAKTKLERNFKVGDCIEAIYYGDNSNRAVWIFPQT
jgi:hypothetical protein